MDNHDYNLKPSVKFKFNSFTEKYSIEFANGAKILFKCREDAYTIYCILNVANTYQLNQVAALVTSYVLKGPKNNHDRIFEE